MTIIDSLEGTYTARDSSTPRIPQTLDDVGAHVTSLLTQDPAHIARVAIQTLLNHTETVHPHSFNGVETTQEGSQEQPRMQQGPVELGCDCSVQVKTLERELGAARQAHVHATHVLDRERRGRIKVEQDFEKADSRGDQLAKEILDLKQQIRALRGVTRDFNPGSRAPSRGAGILGEDGMMRRGGVRERSESEDVIPCSDDEEQLSLD